MPEWSDIWREIRDELQRQQPCPDHPEYPCIRTLRDAVINDIIRVEESGIRVRSHHRRSKGERWIPARDFHAWWEKLEEVGKVSIDPGKSPRGQNSVLVGAIFAICLPTWIDYDGAEQLRLKANVLKDSWGYRIDTGAAAINSVLLGADGPLTEEQITEFVQKRGLKERGAVVQHLLTLKRRGLVTKTPEGFIRTRETESLFDRLDAEAADDDAPIVPYTPESIDRRRIVERAIRERRGQQQFRESLRKRYGDQCLVTGCKVLAVLEAAHINPYRGESDNHVDNGLLLRADIHTLFDLDLLGIEPNRMQIELHPEVVAEYSALIGKELICRAHEKPSKEQLEIRYQSFCACKRSQASARHGKLKP